MHGTLEGHIVYGSNENVFPTLMMCLSYVYGTTNDPESSNVQKVSHSQTLSDGNELGKLQWGLWWSHGHEQMATIIQTFIEKPDLHISKQIYSYSNCLHYVNYIPFKFRESKI